MATAIAGWLVTYGGAAFAASGATGALTVFASNAIFMVGMAAVSYAISSMNKPSLDNLDSGITQNVKSPKSPRRVIYGKRRVGGTIVHAEVTTETDTYLHMVIALAGHEVESISDIQMNGNPLTDFDYAGAAFPREQIRWEGDGHGHNDFSIVVNSVTYSGTIDEIKTAVLAAGGFRANGKYIDITTPSGDDGGDDTLSYEAHFEVETTTVTASLVVTCTDTDKSRQVGNVADTVVYRVNSHIGTPDQLADTNAVLEMPNWTEEHRLRGVAYLYVRLRFSINMFPRGIPNITALVEGKKDIYDPRDGGSYGYTDNAALCCADYLTSDVFGFGASYTDDIDTSALTAAANVCDEAVILDDLSTEPRYTCNGVVDTATDPKQNLEKLMTSMGGKCIFTGGLWKFVCASYRTPTVTLDENSLRDSFTVQTKPPRAELCNAVKGIYISRTEDDTVYQPTDFPVVTNSTYQGWDGGEQIWRDIELQYTSSSSMAQRLAKIELERARQGMTLNYPTTLAALGVVAGDVILINNTRMGWTDKPFEVMDWSFTINDKGALGIDLSLQETASAVYDWNDGEETTIDIAPNTNLLNPFDVPMIDNLVITESAQWATDGVMAVAANVTWDAPPTANISHYEVEGMETGGDTWYRETTTDTSYQINGIPSGHTYYIRVRVVNQFGAASGWEMDSFTADGITETIDPPTDLAIQETVDTLTLTWVNSVVDAQRRGTEIWASLTNDRSTAVLVDTVPGQRAIYNVAGGTTYYVWVRHVDNNSNESAWEPLSATAGVSGAANTGSGLTPEQEASIDASDALIASISDDNTLSISEKRLFDQQYNEQIVNDYNRILLMASDVGLTSSDTVYSDFTDAATGTGGVTELMTPLLEHLDIPSTIVKTTFDNTWDAFFVARQLLLNEISLRTSQRSTWAGTTGTGKPEDNADVTGNNTSQDTSAVGGTASSTVLTNIINAATTADGDSISGDITGTSVVTSPSGQRIVVSATGDELLFYNSAGSLAASVGERSDGTDDCVVYANASNNVAGISSRSTNKTAIKADSLSGYGIATTGTVGLSASGSSYAIQAVGNVSINGNITLSSDSISGVSSLSCSTINCSTSISAYSLSCSGSISAGGLSLGSGDISCDNIGCDNITCDYIDQSGGSGGYGIKCASSSFAIAATGGTVGVWSSGTSYGFYTNSSCYFEGSNYPFTGSHILLAPIGAVLTIGDIISDTSVAVRKDISNVVMFGETTNGFKQKDVVGVLVKVESLDWGSETPLIPRNTETEELPNTHKIMGVNALGEGQINVCPEGGNLEAGDYICSSNTPGKGMKQDDDLLHNYTIAKSREDVTWTQEEIDSNTVKLVACTYHSG